MHRNKDKCVVASTERTSIYEGKTKDGTIVRML